MSEEYKRKYQTMKVRGDRLGEENKRLKEQNEALRVVESAALHYCEAASEGLPAARLDALFHELVEALSWRRGRDGGRGSDARGL